MSDPETADAGLGEAMERLDRALLHARAGGAAVSFDVATPEPERELMGALPSIGGRSVSFSAEPGEGAEESASRATRVLDDLLERAGATVRVETRAGGRLVASTTVGIGGDLASALGAAASPAELALHVQSLERAVRTRATQLRLVLSTLQAAAKIAFAVGTGNILLALPAALRFLRGVMSEIEERKQTA